MLNDDNFLYLKIPRAMGYSLVKAIVQGLICCKHDVRSSPDRVKATEYLLLQFANEIMNTERVASEGADLLNRVFIAYSNEETSSEEIEENV